MQLYKILCLSVGVTLCGCGTQNVISQRDVAPATQEVAARQTPILYPETPSGELAQPKIKVAKQNKLSVTTPENPQKDKVTKIEPLTVERPKITFSATESANIRVPGNNRLPESGILELNLSQLKQDFCYPYPGKVISNYGYRGRSMHSGVDIKAVPRDTIRAAFSGVVRMSKSYSGYGNVIVIRHYCGIETVYSHQAKNLVSPNQVVRAGEGIGLAGRTGRATTEHVHFEVRAACMSIDPSKLLDYSNMSLREGSLFIKNDDGRIIAYNGKSNQVPMTDLQPATYKEYEGEQVASLGRTHSSSAKSSPTSTPTESSPAHHVVRRGDTLSAIARRYSITVASICQLNNISKNGVLSLGQRLKLR